MRPDNALTDVAVKKCVIFDPLYNCLLSSGSVVHTDTIWYNGEQWARILTKAGTTLLTGKPPSVSSLPMTSSWHISMAAWSCWDSSPVACRPCNSCWALEPGKMEAVYLIKKKKKAKSTVMWKWLYLLAPLPIVLWNSCDIRGPKGPKRCGGRPRASSRAIEIKITNVLCTTSPIHAQATYTHL